MAGKTDNNSGGEQGFLASVIAESTQKIKDRAAQVSEAIDNHVATHEAMVGPLRDELKDLERTLKSMGVGVAAKAKRSGAGRPSGGGKTQERIVEVVTANPGIAVKDIAEKLGMASPNYLYRALPKLVEQGVLVKDADGGYSVAAKASTPSAPEKVEEPVAA